VYRFFFCQEEIAASNKIIRKAIGKPIDKVCVTVNSVIYLF